jgi:hypothetical protein
MAVFGAKPPPKPTPAEPDESVVMMGLDGDHLKRLALQGQRGPAAELARRTSAESITAFLLDVLTKDELERLSGGQFNTLNDQFQLAWRDRQLRDTVEIEPVAQTNLNTKGWSG